jgi:threonine 3-dehydrogenase
MEPTAGPDDVLIRVLRTAICGTDVHIYQWNDWAKATIPIPMVIGHEFVGEILEMGTNVRDYVPGTLVSGEGHIVCGRCRNCMAGRRHLCRHACGIGVDRQGAFAEYIAIPSANIWQHAAGIDLDVASIFDPFGNAAHTALQWDLVGEDVLITGAGPIGVMACAICRHAGARHVVISDVNEYRLLLASNLGATRTVNVRQERIADVQIELGMTEGFDIGLEMSGSEQALLELLDNMCHGGKVSILGIPNDNVAIDWRKVVFNMLTIKGIYGREIFETWYKMTVMLQSGLNLLPLITHRLPYTSFEEGFEAMLTGKAGKVVLTWE